MPHRRLKIVATAAAIVAFLATTPASAQLALTQIEIRLERIPGGGCIHCDPASLGAYQVKILGDGTVEYHSLEEAEGVKHVRIVAVDDVIALANAFIAAGFLEARENYAGTIQLVRKGDGVVLQGSGAIDERNQTRLELRIGDHRKAATLVDHYPEALGRLPELVDRIGGPATW